jgi:hypothetical protein
VSRERIAALVEITVLAIALLGVNLIFFRSDPGFSRTAPHPALFLTLLVLARYGLIAGVAAAAVLAIEYGALLVFVAHRPLYDILSAPLATPLVVLVPTSVFFGIVVQRHLDRQRRAEAESATAKEKLDKAETELGRLRDVNVKLGEKIVHADLTTLTLFNQLKLLSTLSRDELERAVLSMMVETLRVDAASIWGLSDDGLYLRCHVGDAPRTPLEIDDTLERRFMNDVLAARQIAEAERGHLPFLVGRLRAGKGGDVVGYLAITHLPFSASGEALRLFGPLVEWLAIATGNALAYEHVMTERQGQKALR